MVPAGSPLVEVGDARALEVVVDVLSRDAVRVRPGQRVLVTEWGGDRALEGRVRTVEPAAFLRVSALGVEEQRVNVRVDLAAAPAALGVASEDSTPLCCLYTLAFPVALIAVILPIVFSRIASRALLDWLHRTFEDVHVLREGEGSPADP